MIKKTIKILILAFSSSVLFLIFYLVYLNYLKPTPKRINNQLSVFLNKDYLTKPTILVIFSPECGPCQALIKNIYNNRDSLSKINLLLASTRDSITSNVFFLGISNTWVKDMKNKNIIYDSRDKIGTYFVEMGLPKVYIFDRNGTINHVTNGPINLDSIKLMLKKYD